MIVSGTEEEKISRFRQSSEDVVWLANCIEPFSIIPPGDGGERGGIGHDALREGLGGTDASHNYIANMEHGTSNECVGNFVFTSVGMCLVKRKQTLHPFLE